MSGCYASFHKQLGDLTLLEPALSRLHAHHGGPVRLLTRSGHAPLVELMEGVKYVSGAAMAPASHLYCFDPLGKSAFRSTLTPVSNRLLVIPERRELRWFHPLLFPKIKTPELGDEYIAEFFWKNTPVPTANDFRPPRLQRPPESWAPAGVAPRSYVLVNATAGWRMKMWTASGWAETLRAHESLGPFLLTNGGQMWQTTHCGEIVSKVSDIARTIETDLRAFLWLCANARAVLTVDGSASHLAGAFGVPSLTLFGPTNIHHWHREAPLQSALRAPVDKDGKRRLRKLGADPVIEAVARLTSQA